MNEISITLNHELPIGRILDLVGEVIGVEQDQRSPTPSYRITLRVGTKDGLERGALAVMDHFDSGGNLRLREELA